MSAAEVHQAMRDYLEAAGWTPLDGKRDGLWETSPEAQDRLAAHMASTGAGSTPFETTLAVRCQLEVDGGMPFPGRPWFGRAAA